MHVAIAQSSPRSGEPTFWVLLGRLQMSACADLQAVVAMAQRVKVVSAVHDMHSYTKNTQKLCMSGLLVDPPKPNHATNLQLLHSLPDCFGCRR